MQRKIRPRAGLRPLPFAGSSHRRIQKRGPRIQSVQKETGLHQEYGLVASVFLNRLAQNMRLQSDPTIIYGLVGGKGRLSRPIRLSEIKQKTAYNTYQIAGLPPTPITNPGRDAIAAVLRPPESPYFYFVADGKGGHVFAKNLKEHEENVRRWRLISKRQKQ